MEELGGGGGGGHGNRHHRHRVAYGSQGHRKDVELFGPKKQDHPFEPGNIDEFEVSGYR